jgi:hypothetical protein
VKVFLDCRCDIDYIRKEIPYVNYVRDVREAQLYILITSQNTGSGGNQYTYSFQGQGKFGGMIDTLVYSSYPDETSSLVREGQVNMLKMGLMRYVARTPLANEIEIRHNDELRVEEVIDKWNNWVFEIRTSQRFSRY